MRELNAAELERAAVFALGFALGFVLFVMALELVEQWVIAGDLADRRRIREVLQEWIVAQAQDDAQESPPEPAQALSLTRAAAE